MDFAASVLERERARPTITEEAEHYILQSSVDDKRFGRPGPADLRQFLLEGVGAIETPISPSHFSCF